MIALVAFEAIFPEVGLEAYRTLVIGEGQALPPEKYLFREYYCVDPKCDCRRVTLNLIPERDMQSVAAVISYGWETPTFYRKWSKAPGNGWRDMCGASLEGLSDQGPDAEKLLLFFENLVRNEPAMTAHFRRQYRKVKERVKAGGFTMPAPPRA